MSLLAIGDLHLTDNPRDAYRFNTFKTVARIIGDKGITHVVILGDLTTAKDQHRAGLVNRIVDNIHILSQLATVIALRGNHDYRDVQNPFFKFIETIPNVIWINNPRSVHIKSVGTCLFLPHTYDYESDWKILKIGPPPPRWIFAHQTFAGAVGEGGRELEGIPLDYFPEKAHIISGDIHTPQIIKEFGGRYVYYVGTPYLVNFGDGYRPRLVMIDDKGLTPIYLKGKQKRLVEIKSIDELARIDHVNPGDIVKVRVSIAMSDHAHWHERQEQVRKWCAEHQLNVDSIVPMTTTTKKRADKTPRATDTRTDAEIVRDYSQVMQLDEATEAVGLKIIDAGVRAQIKESVS